MKEILQELNRHSGERVFFYGIVFVFSLWILLRGIAFIIECIKE